MFVNNRLFTATLSGLICQAEWWRRSTHKLKKEEAQEKRMRLLMIVVRISRLIWIGVCMVVEKGGHFLDSGVEWVHVARIFFVHGCLNKPQVIPVLAFFKL